VLGLRVVLGVVDLATPLFCASIRDSAFFYPAGLSSADLICRIWEKMLHPLLENRPVHVFPPPQQNLWADSGSGRRPNV
jgi:hypothetical protein